jgi:hypothetical protein
MSLFPPPSTLPPSSASRAGCPSPATRPVRMLRCEPVASSAGQPLARGGRADPRRGHQRAGWQQSGMGWADAVGGKGRLIFLSPQCEYAIASSEDRNCSPCTRSPQPSSTPNGPPPSCSACPAPAKAMLHRAPPGSGALRGARQAPQAKSDRRRRRAARGSGRQRTFGFPIGQKYINLIQTYGVVEPER